MHNYMHKYHRDISIDTLLTTPADALCMGMWVGVASGRMKQVLNRNHGTPRKSHPRQATRRRRRRAGDLRAANSPRGPSNLQNDGRKVFVE
jgi:hypothetical protein